MHEYFLYPIWSFIDPETLDDPLRDELQWYVDFSIPVLPIPSVADMPFAFDDPEGLGEQPPEEVINEAIVPLSEPVLPLWDRASLEPSYFIDDESLGDPEDTRLTWFQALSEPVLPIPPTAEGWYADDLETIGDPEKDEIQWFEPLSEPVLPLHPRAVYEPAAFDDPEGIADPLRDEVQWFRPLDEPVLPRHNLAWFDYTSPDITSLGDVTVEIVTLDEHMPLSEPIFVPWPEAAFSPLMSIDTETLGEPLRDEIQWFEPLSEPILPLHPQALYEPATFDDPEGLADPLRDELQWFNPLSEPIRAKPDTAWMEYSSPDITTFEEAVVEIVTLDEFVPLSEPIFVTPTQQPSEIWFDPEALGDPLEDKLEWFQPLSEPVRARANLAHIPSAFYVQEIFVSTDVSFEWFEPFSEPVLPRLDVSWMPSAFDSAVHNEPPPSAGLPGFYTASTNKTNSRSTVISSPSRSTVSGGTPYGG